MAAVACIIVLVVTDDAVLQAAGSLRHPKFSIHEIACRSYILLHLVFDDHRLCPRLIILSKHLSFVSISGFVSATYPDFTSQKFTIELSNIRSQLRYELRKRKEPKSRRGPRV